MAGIVRQNRTGCFIFLLALSGLYMLRFNDESSRSEQTALQEEALVEHCARVCSRRSPRNPSSAPKLEETPPPSETTEIGRPNDDNDDNMEDATHTKTSLFDFLPPLPNRHASVTTLEDQDVAFVTRQFERAGIRTDTLVSGGRSCVWDYIRDHQVICQDCSSEQQDEESTCQESLPINDTPLITSARGKKFEWDEPPRKSSSFNPMTFLPLSDRVLTMYVEGFGPSYQDAQCDSSVLEWPCFDLERCFAKTAEESEHVLTVYMENPSFLAAYTKDFPPHIQVVEDPSEACLIVICDESYGSKPTDYLKMIGADSWNGGQNHFLWKASNMFGSTMDFPVPMFLHFEFAAISSFALSDAQFRRHYDVAIAYQAQWTPSQEIADRVKEEQKEKRPILLSFKGKFIENFGSPYEYHRWIAPQYWDLGKGDVLVDLYAEHTKPYYDYPESQYSDFLLNCTFSFCPGGQSPGSYRFLESMLAGAIPVVITSFVAPLEPEVDWSGCLVRVSEARLIELPEMLRQISHEEIVRRRRECRMLWESLQVHPGGNDFGFSASIVVWHSRIRRAQRRRNRRKALRQSILQYARPTQMTAAAAPAR